MKSFALYRLPYAETYTKVTSDDVPQIVSDLKDIGKTAGYVIAPFKPSDSTPAVLLVPKQIKNIPVGHTANTSDEGLLSPTENKSTENYRKAFNKFHNAVVNKEFTKLVLARDKEIETNIDTCENLFHNLCIRYPRPMIQLFSTPLTGTWVIATPEILIEGKNATYHTMALAGTMPYKEGVAEWSEKNKGEQHVVEKYIEDIIIPFSSQVVKDGPYTSRAGDIVHLRTDFRFHLKEGTSLGKVIKSLHPTPAVCGLPRNEAMQFIIENEGIERRYYSGFAGPVGINDETHLYVSLRCAVLSFDNMGASHATLFAGGGIMPDSQCESEWKETELKMQTINNVLK